VVVTYDYAAARPVPVPDWCRSRIEEYEGRNVSRGSQFPPSRDAKI
jgi:hypothetical protein